MVYGIGTRSYNASTEARENKRAQAEATAAYLAQPPAAIVAPIVCNCRSYRFPHSPQRHSTLAHQADWTPWEKRYRFIKEYNSLEEARKPFQRRPSDAWLDGR